MSWILLSLQLVPNDLQVGVFMDWAKLMHANVYREFYVYTQNLGTCIFSGPYQGAYEMLPIKNSDIITDALSWVKSRIVTLHM